MAIYVFDETTGELVSWCPGDADPVASADVLAAKGLASVPGLPALDATHAWSAAQKTVVAVPAQAVQSPIATGTWILRFTPAEFQAINASTDPQVQQFLYALNHTTQIDLSDAAVVGGVSYLVSINLLAAARVAAIVAAP
jgi:hypothetical protein